MEKRRRAENEIFSGLRIANYDSGDHGGFALEELTDTEDTSSAIQYILVVGLESGREGLGRSEFRLSHRNTENPIKQRAQRIICTYVHIQYQYRFGTCLESREIQILCEYKALVLV